LRPKPALSLPLPLWAAQRGDLVFDPKLLPFKFREYEVVGVRSVLFFFNEMLEFSMFGPQRVNVLCHGHARPSDQ
jgi:hypothetical protein